MGGRRVLIVGGGIAGLALARMLARTRVAVEVIEREPVWRPAGTGMYRPGNATRALRALGLDTRVACRSVEIPRQRFCDQRGRLLCEVDIAALWRPVGPCVALHRDDLHVLLREAARDVPIRLGQVVDRVTQRNGIVSVKCSDGTSGDYDLVVAADGINSAVRRLTFEPTAIPRPVGQVGWRFVGSRPPEVTTWSMMSGRRTVFLTLPIGDDRVYCYCDVLSAPVPDSAGRAPAARLTRLFSEFADPAATLLDTLDAATEIHVSTRSPSTPGCVTTLCSSAMPRTRRRRTWPKAWRWRSRTRSCSPSACATSERSLTPSRHSRPDADPEPIGSAPRPTAATTPDTSRPPSGTASCDCSGGGSSTPTTAATRPALNHRFPRKQAPQRAACVWTSISMPASSRAAASALGTARSTRQ
jgi:hypothetical protein